MTDFDITPQETSEAITAANEANAEDVNNSSTPKAQTAISRWYAIQVASSCEKKV